MVQITSFLVAVAALTTAVSAAPLPRPAPCMGASCAPAPQPMYEPPMKAEQPKYEPPMKSEQPKYEPPMKYEQPKYEQPKYEPPMKSEQPKYEPPMKQEPPMKEEKPMKQEPPMMHEPPMMPEKEVKPTQQYEPTTTMMHEQPKPSMYPEPVKEVKPATPPPEMPKYGSGSTPPPQNQYNDCVSKCMATYGAPPTSWTPPPTPPSEAGKASEFVTVLVAPQDGVLRYVPPMIDVPVGKTVKFVWNGTKDHTVSKGTVLDLCNRSATAFFTSGVQKGPHEFTQKINDTDPVYFYCAVSPHCSKGMFGIVNMPKKAGENMTVKAMMPLMTAQSADLAAAWSTVHAKTQGTPADTWGDDYDLSTIPAAHREGAMSSVIYYRSFLAENPGVQELNSGAALPEGTTNFKFPADVSQLLSNSASNPAGGPGAVAGGAPTNAVPTGAPPSTSALGSNSNKTNAAGTLKSSGFMVALVAILATMVAL